MRVTPVHQVLPHPEPRPPRPAAAIVAKDTTPFVQALFERPDGALLVLEEPGLAAQTGRLLRRNATTFAIEAELGGVVGQAALSPSGRWLLTGGPRVGGMEASCQLIDLDAFAIVRTLPLMRPFQWVDDERFVAQTPNWVPEHTDSGYAPSTRRRVDPRIAEKAPSLLEGAPGLVLVEREGLAARPLLTSRLLDEEKALALSPDRSTVYAATNFSRISAVRLSDGALRWQRPPSETVMDGTVYNLVVEPHRGRVLALGGGLHHDVQVLDGGTGEVLERHLLENLLVPLSSRKKTHPTCGVVRSDGLVVAGTAGGALVEITPDGTWRACKVAPKGCRALAFIRGGTALLVGGEEKNLRLVPLAETAP